MRVNSSSGSAGMTVLIVDDDREVTHLLATALQRWRYTPLQANSATDALRIVRGGPVDAALVDVRMPDMDGFLLLQLLKKSEDSMLIVMMTGYSELEDARRAMKLGAYDYITKPFALDSLRVILKTGLMEKAAFSLSGSTR